MKNLNEKAINPAEKFLDRRGYEILDSNWEAPDGFGTVDIIAVDEGAIVALLPFVDEFFRRDQRDVDYYRSALREALDGLESVWAEEHCMGHYPPRADSK